jgi:hypothetical protein
MRFLITGIGILFFLLGCRSPQSQKLEHAFLLSIQKNDFEVLRRFLPDKEFYQSLGDKMPPRSDEEINKFIAESNDRVKEAWQNTLFNVLQKKIDLRKVKINEVIYYDPFPKDASSEAMIVNYEYDGRDWDDIQFIVGRYKGKTYLLGIPNPTRAFSMADPELRATNEARAWREIKNPAFKKNLENLTATLIKAVRENDLNTFGWQLIYRGDDESRKWRSALNLNDSTEKKQASDFMQRISASLASCTSYLAGDIHTEREAEGLWIVLPLKCEGKVISFAYLRIHERLLLGDVGVSNQ